MTVHKAEDETLRCAIVCCEHWALKAGDAQPCPRVPRSAVFGQWACHPSGILHHDSETTVLFVHLVSLKLKHVHIGEGS